MKGPSKAHPATKTLGGPACCCLALNVWPCLAPYAPRGLVGRPLIIHHGRRLRDAKPPACFLRCLSACLP